MGKRLVRRGFTLIELMMVVAIIGLLAAIAIPKFADLVIKAKEASIRGKLGSFRSAIAIYHANNEGVYPFNLNTLSLLTPRYISEIPTIEIPTVPDHNPGWLVTPVGLTIIVPGTMVTNSTWDNGNNTVMPHARPWGYSNATGHIVANCSHTDSRGVDWSLQ